MRRCTLPLLLVVCLPLVPGPRACAPVLPVGGTAQVADESAIIIWEATTRTQHFIRRATFLTSAPNLGFLVPTPTKPEIKPASDDAFKHLEKVTEAKTRTIVRDYSRYGKKYYGHMKSMAPAMPGGGAMESPAVRLLGEGRVGHLDYAILEADKTEALQDWLKTNGYSTRPALDVWLGQYIEKKWKITAFKFAKDEKAPGSSDGVATSSVRMTFETDKPIFPYSEPEDQRLAFGGGAGGPGLGRDPRLLRIYFLGDNRFRGDMANGHHWPASVPWANQPSQHDREVLFGHLAMPANTAPLAEWLTEFEDRSAPRNGTADLLFSPESHATITTRPDIVVEVDPEAPPGAAPVRSMFIVGGIGGGIILLLIVSAFLFWRTSPEPNAA